MVGDAGARSRWTIRVVLWPHVHCTLATWTCGLVFKACRSFGRKKKLKLSDLTLPSKRPSAEGLMRRPRLAAAVGSLLRRAASSASLAQTSPMASLSGG